MKNLKSNSGNSWVKTFKNSDGSYDSFSWSLGDSFATGFLGFAVGVLAILTFSFIQPMITLFFLPLKDKINAPSLIISIIVGVFTICDYHYGLFGWHFLHIYPNFYDGMLLLTLSLIILCLTMLFMGNKIMSEIRLAKSPFSRWLLFVIVFTSIFCWHIDGFGDMIGMAIPPVEVIVPVDSWGLPIE